MQHLPGFLGGLDPKVVLASNYTPPVPWWGEYHGTTVHDTLYTIHYTLYPFPIRCVFKSTLPGPSGLLHFFSIWNKAVNVDEFNVTKIHQDGAIAVIEATQTVCHPHDASRQCVQPVMLRWVCLLVWHV
jgi:hypothetical protein